MHLRFQILIVVSVSDWLNELTKKLTHRQTYNTQGRINRLWGPEQRNMMGTYIYKMFSLSDTD